ncbi:transglycosylase SLT domain-containing protein [Pseudoduganella lutea]|uniref:LysM peptidoglycan-binding domain-containing protein n=1 Tax=Pseudoduganella lutea TaxID=321985 RepID=A0A4P6KSE4_9BURK|nr:transglycosylase SLT domain-containing protein [Pseudoduganella lutea]QBE62029.1 LysM peptidoglycan-binding domain-containing protein [Pseudoduganella lutea]
MRIKYISLLAALAAAPAISLAVESAVATDRVSLPLIPLSSAIKAPAPNLATPPAYATKTSAEDPFRETDVWNRIRTGFSIPDLNNPLVTKHANWYADRPDHMARTSARASLYLFHVVTELEKRNMPTELALLPFIESAFNPVAVSSANAGGMWQFMPGTGRDFNLKQNAFKDDRRSVLASTDAALTYLQKLYDMFGDWQLALAAYNWGEGSVQKAIAKNRAAGKPTDFDSLAHLMPAETRNYVPKLQAVKNIVANPSRFGLSLPLIRNEPYFTTVDKTSDIDLAIAAQLAELSVDEFKALNPQFKRPVITGGEQTQILLPKENAEKFHLNLAQWGQALSTWTTHRVSSARESIASLASKFRTTPDVIRKANNLPSRGVLTAGSTILVPKISTSTHIDIPVDIADNATVNVADEPVAKRSNYRKAKASNSKSKSPIKLVKARVSRDQASKKRRN